MSNTAELALVLSQIADGARAMHLASDSAEVKAAREIAIAAIEDGRSVEDAYTFARSALVPNAGVVAA